MDEMKRWFLENRIMLMAQRIDQTNELDFLYKRIRDHTNELVQETEATKSPLIDNRLAADQGHALRIVVGEGLIAIAKAIEKSGPTVRTPLDHSKVRHE